MLQAHRWTLCRRQDGDMEGLHAHIHQTAETEGSDQSPLNQLRDSWCRVQRMESKAQPLLHAGTPERPCLQPTVTSENSTLFHCISLSLSLYYCPKREKDCSWSVIQLRLQNSHLPLQSCRELGLVYLLILQQLLVTLALLQSTTVRKQLRAVQD